MSWGGGVKGGLMLWGVVDGWEAQGHQRRTKCTQMELRGMHNWPKGRQRRLGNSQG